MEYHKKTVELIERMCLNVEREDFTLDKVNGLECLMKTYDLFNLPRPKKVVWVKDVFDKRFVASARSACSAGSARSAWSAGSAGSALDYDFDWYVFEFEYCKNPTSDKPNENDKKYLDYCELLMKAKECGIGYWAECKDVLYLVPTPLVKIDERNRFHSLSGSAIQWKGGKKLYRIHGVEFDQKLWTKVVEGMKPQDVFAIKNLEQRRIAYELMDKTSMKKLKGFKVLDKVDDDGYGNLMEILEFKLEKFSEPLRYLRCFCPSTKREYLVETRQTKCWAAKNSSFGLEGEIKWVKEW